MHVSSLLFACAIASCLVVLCCSSKVARRSAMPAADERLLSMDGATGHWRKRGKSVPASPFVSALMHACMHASPARTCGPVRARAPHHRPHHDTTHPGRPARPVPSRTAALAYHVGPLRALHSAAATMPPTAGNHDAALPFAALSVDRTTQLLLAGRPRPWHRAGNHDGALAFAGRGRSVDRIQLLVAGRPAGGIFSSTRTLCTACIIVDSLPSRRRN